MQKETENTTESEQTFVEGLDFYFDEGLMVLTRKYLLDRGRCCDTGCRHCPYSAASAAVS
ncbi:MAG: DUF5522 domain-containing protein [Pyrinomonadaceae bacterium]